MEEYKISKDKILEAHKAAFLFFFPHPHHKSTNNFSEKKIFFNFCAYL